MSYTINKLSAIRVGSVTRPGMYGDVGRLLKRLTDRRHKRLCGSGRDCAHFKEPAAHPRLADADAASKPSRGSSMSCRVQSGTACSRGNGDCWQVVKILTTCVRSAASCCSEPEAAAASSTNAALLWVALSI